MSTGSLLSYYGDDGNFRDGVRDFGMNCSTPRICPQHEEPEMDDPMDLSEASENVVCSSPLSWTKQVEPTHTITRWPPQNLLVVGTMEALSPVNLW